MEANQEYYSSPKEFFDTFTESVYAETIEISETAKLARNAVRRRKPYSTKGDTKSFPENKIHELL